MKLTSTAFSAGAVIPARYTCEGANVSPPLAWNAAPAAAQSFVLIFDDPDDDGPQPWSHWVIFNLRAGSAGLDENVPTTASPGGAVQGTNSFRKVGYGGPCPPTGSHRYFFRLTAVDRRLDLGPSATREDVLKAIEGHVLAEAELMGTYQRAKKS